VSCLVTLAAQALCLVSFSDLTLRADVSSQLSGDFSYRVNGRDFGGGHVGRIALDLPLASYRGFTLAALAEHTSLIDTTRDRGQERIGLTLVWRPFR
jgi:hypothetical protein